MARLIDADALPVHKAYCVDEAGWGANFYVVDKSDIDNAPTVDAVEVVHGRWISHEGYEECHLCHRKAMFPHNYCPHCGAKMDGGKEK